MEESFYVGPHWRLVLEPIPAGVYIFLYDKEDSELPERHWVKEDVASAKQHCLDEFGTPPDSWHAYFGARLID